MERYGVSSVHLSSPGQTCSKGTKQRSVLEMPEQAWGCPWDPIPTLCGCSREMPVKIWTGFLFFSLGPLPLVLLTAHFNFLLPR